MNFLLNAVAGGATMSFMLLSSEAALCQPIPLTSLKPLCTCEVRKVVGVQLGLETLILFDKHLLF